MKRSVIIILLCCVLLGIYLRVINHDLVFTGDETHLYGADSHYHLRRITRTIEHYPSLNNFDPFMAYPYGADCVWPPLFDFSIATMSKLAGYDETNRTGVEQLASVFPVLAGAFTILAVFFLGAELFGPTAGLLSAFLLAILPGHVQATMLGHVDHHAIEPLLTVLILLASIRMLQSGSPLKTGIILGILLALALYGWRGSIVVSGLLGIYLFTVSMFISAPVYRRSLVTANLAAYTTAFILVTPYCLTTPWGKNYEVTFIALSLFHVIFFLSFALLFAFQRIILYLDGPLIERKRFFIYSLSLPFAAVVVASGIAPDYVKNLLSGFEYIGKVDPWLQSISEFQPLFRSQGLWDPQHPQQMLGYGVYVLPVILTWLVIRTSIGKSLTPRGDFFLLWSIIIGFICLLQRRYVHQLSVITAICIAFAFTYSLGSYMFQISPLRRASLIVLLFLSLFPVYTYYVPLPGGYPTYESKYSSVIPELREMFYWIKTNTPPPYSFTPPAAIRQDMPGYGIMAPWSYGHWIMYLADRPVIANNFGYAQHGLKTSMKFYLSDDPDEVNEILTSLNVRYVIIELMLSHIQEYSEAIESKKKYIQQEEIKRDENGVVVREIFPENSFYNIISTRLFFLDRSRNRNSRTHSVSKLNCGDHQFTLIYESADGQYRLFEFR